MRKNDGLALSSATVILYASAYPVGAIALDYVSPFLLILLRFGLSAVLLWATVAVRRPPVVRGTALVWSVAAGVLVQGVQFLGLYWGMAHGVGAGVASLVIAMNPVATAIVGRAFLGRREDAWGLLALATGVAGILLACLPRVLADPSIGIGIVATLVGLVGLSTGSILQTRIRGGVDPTLFTAIGVTASVPLAAGACLTTDQQVDHPLPAVGMLLVVVILSAIATTLYATCVRRAGAREAAILFAVIPAVASVFSWVLTGEPLTATTLAALVFGALACFAQGRSPVPERPVSRTYVR